MFDNLDSWQFFGLLTIALIVVVYSIGFLGVAFLVNPVTQQECDNVALSGYKTDIKYVTLLGITEKYCFVEFDGKLVPYDKWMPVDIDTNTIKVGDKE